jgi:hypothetical protein
MTMADRAVPFEMEKCKAATAVGAATPTIAGNHSQRLTCLFRVPGISASSGDCMEAPRSADLKSGFMKIRKPASYSVVQDN